MFDIPALLIVIPGLPLAAAVATAALGRPVLGPRSHVPVVLALAVSLAASLLLVERVGQGCRSAEGGIGFERTVALWSWAEVGPEDAAVESASPAFRVDVTLRADPLTAIMLAFVTFIALLVAVYSIGYMHGDRGYWRFFSYLGLFVFSMTMLVSVSNFLLLYVFWEAVGLCSYLLIGFWYERPAAAAAGKKAFLVNRVGDFGFALGVFLLWTTYGTLDFHDTVTAGQVTGVGILGQTVLADPARLVGGATGTAICLLLLLGACGKSAQFPLHVWLPDAMEGPSPVSALIHAATMVTAGVYLVARCMPLWAVSTGAQHAVAVVGAFTALLAALIAITQNDLKRILAYSTISQLGYMFLALGAGTMLGVTAGMFHLVTHAFFKALLFLAAGSVMHAMGGVIDIRRFGGLRRRLPVTFWTFLVGALALAGVFPFAGFWSKDAILVALHEQAGAGQRLFLTLYLVALAVAGLTAFYTFRAVFRTFFGPERLPDEAGGHAHESPRVMTGPLLVLAACAVLAGGVFELTHGFANFLHKTPSVAFLGDGPDFRATKMGLSPSDAPARGRSPFSRSEKGTVPASHESAASHLAVAVLGTTLALGGIALAAVLYVFSPALGRRLAQVMKTLGLYQLSRDRFLFDEIYQWLLARPAAGLAWLCHWCDRNVVDRLVDWCGLAPVVVGAALRPLQNGLVQYYALAMVLGLLALFGALMM
ncbi:MAG: NADH-quinone oxidoreductase subunit L [Pirellulales bacterium]|nr:NADH-quinone oxidoreductase subunit L [Pirellulales bacterium]